MNQPTTREGWQIWDLTRRMQNQLRTEGRVVIGFDLGAVMTFASALGIAPAAVAEFMPAIESAACHKLNEETRQNG